MNPSIFHKANAVASRALDSTHGEVITILMMAPTINAKPSPDTKRADQEVIAIFVEENAGDRAGQNKNPSSKTRKGTSEAQWFSIDLRSLSEPIRRDDIIYRHRTRHKYRIRAVVHDEGRLKCFLALLTADKTESINE